MKARGYSKDLNQCTFCGAIGHRAHRCPMRDRGANVTLYHGARGAGGKPDLWDRYRMHEAQRRLMDGDSYRRQAMAADQSLAALRIRLADPTLPPGTYSATLDVLDADMGLLELRVLAWDEASKIDPAAWMALAQGTNTGRLSSTEPSMVKVDKL
jgi:hypothetical protein